MGGERQFPHEKVVRLHSAERLDRQPPTPVVDLVASWAPESVLDIGVGSGWYDLPLAARLPAARIIGLDVEPRMFEVLEERTVAAGQAGAVETLQAPPDRIPLGDDVMDVALMINRYHELDDRPGYLRELQRVLTPQGRLLVCDWDPTAASDFGPPMDHRIPQATLEHELHEAGFTGVATHDGYAHLYLVTATATN